MPEPLKKSAADGRQHRLFAELDRLIRCLFCGDDEESRFMCRKCRLIPLGEIFWIVRVK